MKISSVNCNQKIYEQYGKKPAFRGLFGCEVARTFKNKKVELHNIDKYYAFKDELISKVAETIENAVLNGVRVKKGDIIKVKYGIGLKLLPFTQEEYIKYKSKDGKILTKKLLSEKDKEMDDFFDLDSEKGLSLYQNKYRENPLTKISDALTFIKNIFKK